MVFFGKDKADCSDDGSKVRRFPSLREMLARALALRFSLVFNYLMLALLGIGIGLVSLLLGATGLELPVFRLYFSSPMLLLLNLLPPVLLIFFLYFASGRAWVAFSFPSFIVIAISVVHFFKIQVRGDPLLASDIAFAREAGNVMSGYSLTLSWKIYLAVAAFVVGVLFSIFALKCIPKKKPVRIIGATAIIAAAAILYPLVYANSDLYAQTEADIWGTDWSVARKYVASGFLYPFIHSISIPQEETPDWYNEQEAQQLWESFSDAEIPDEKKVNVISIMLEAYTDLSIFGVIDFEIDVYAPLHRLQAESVSGTLVTNTFGGGTIDTERLFLTGNTHLTTFNTATNSYIHYLKSQGYNTQGLHAGDRWFYDRYFINAFLGFDTYYFIEDFEDGSHNDSFFFPAVLEMYMERDKNMPYFSFNISYQNHGGYYSDRTREPHHIARGELTEGSFNILNNYLSGISDTTSRIEVFFDPLRTDPDPVVVLVFGDHMPWLGNNNSVYNELGIDVNASTEEGYYNRYSTPYFIWANDAAKKVLGNDFVGDGGSFSPCFLMGEVFRLCSWEGDGFMQALREFKAIVDIISPPSGIARENGVLAPDLTPQTRELYTRLRMMEIYRLNNFWY